MKWRKKNVNQDNVHYIGKTGNTGQLGGNAVAPSIHSGMRQAESNIGHNEFIKSQGSTGTTDAIIPKESNKLEVLNMTREELDAKLGQNKAEVQAIASGMREEMAAWRETQNAQMVQMNATLTSMSAKMDAKFEVIDAKMDSIDKSLNGRIDGVNSAITGINTAISGIQSGISTKLTIFGVVMAVILAVAGLYFSSNQSAQQPQPTVIYVQQPPAQQSK